MLTETIIAFTKGTRQIFFEFVLTDKKSLAPLLETPTTNPSFLSSVSYTESPTSSSIRPTPCGLPTESICCSVRPTEVTARP